MFAATPTGLRHPAAVRYAYVMRTDAGRQITVEAQRTELRARWEAVETVKARELASMTEERAQEIIQSLGAVEGWRERPDWSGLVEQQALFHRDRRS